jgi:hypothetical protein
MGHLGEAELLSRLVDVEFILVREFSGASKVAEHRPSAVGIWG